MTLLAGVRGVIFDMDGVLWRSQAAHHEAFQYALAPLGIQPPAYSEIAGRKTAEVMQWMLERHGLDSSPESVQALTREKQDRANQLLREKPPISCHCTEVLRSLAKSRTLALASSASGRSVQLFLDATGTRDLFTAVLSGDEVTTAKPSPEIYLKGLERLGVPREETVVVEDAPSGIRAANRAGLRVIAVAGTCTEEELAKEDVIAVVKELPELLDDRSPAA